MCVNELMELAGQIQAMSLPAEQEEALMVQAADLVRFKESYPGELRVVDPLGRITIVDSEAGTAGICFYGKEDKGTLKLMLAESKRAKRLNKVKELWFVYVAAAGEACRESTSGFINHHGIRQLCNKVFLLNYNTATVQSL